MYCCTARDFGTSDRDLRLLAVLPTFVTPLPWQPALPCSALETDEQMRSALHRPGIRQCTDLRYATARHETIWEFAPRSRAAGDCAAFLDLVEQDRVAQEAVDGQQEQSSVV